jgi:hypothetical protein
MRSPLRLWLARQTLEEIYIFYHPLLAKFDKKAHRKNTYINTVKIRY